MENMLFGFVGQLNKVPGKPYRSLSEISEELLEDGCIPILITSPDKIPLREVPEREVIKVILFVEYLSPFEA